MKRILLFALLFSHSLFAQKTDYDKIILPEGAFSGDFAEKLVRVAWLNYPQNEIAKRNINVASEQVTQAKMQWLDIITIQGNLNEYTIKGTSNTNGFVAFPRYNFGATIRLGMFGDIPAEVRKTKEQLKISEAELNMQKLVFRAEVLRRYQNYLLYKELFENQVTLTENSFSGYSVAEQRFKNGEITLQDYNASLEKYNQENINQLRAETEMNIAKIDLEELLGVELETIK